MMWLGNFVAVSVVGMVLSLLLQDRDTKCYFLLELQPNLWMRLTGQRLSDLADRVETDPA